MDVSNNVSSNKLKVSSVPIKTLVPDPSNPRAHDDRNIDSIIASLNEHGQVEPLIVQKSTNMVIGGNGRMEAMKRMGWKETNVVLLEVSDEKARRLSITLNRTAELATWDLPVLAKHLDELSIMSDEFISDDLGFTNEEYMELVSSFDTLGFDEVDIDEAHQDDEIVAGDKGNNSLPAGTQPKDMPSSHVRMIQLFFNEETEPNVRLWAAQCAELYGTDNMTDTIYECLRRTAEDLGEANA